MGLRTNERIRVPQIRVIDDKGEQMGVMTPREALTIARERGFDLIEVAPNAQPPVCRIMDYGKYKYEQSKRESEQKKKAHQSELKAMTLRPGTDDHDLDIKIKNIIKFLGDGDKVKVTVRFRSRELSHPEFAHQNLQKIVNGVTGAGVGIVERPAILEGRQMIMILAPGKDAGKKAAAAPKEAKPKPAAAPAASPAAAEVPAPATTSAPAPAPAPEAAPTAE
ncbi:MAG: translation initiation factor IF-3 [Armatimonas sp.]